MWFEQVLNGFYEGHTYMPMVVSGHFPLSARPANLQIGLGNSDSVVGKSLLGLFLINLSS